MNTNIYDVLVIGAGITGSFIARELSKYQLKVGVIEKSNDVGNGTTNANSAIVHSGYDPIPGTNKAKFNVLGNKMFDQIADELDVSFQKIGSLTVANFKEQVPMLEELKKRSEENGVPVEILTGEQVREMEPNIPDSFGALFAPTAGIINPFNLCIHAMENAVDNGVELFLSNKVENIEFKNNLFLITTNKDTYQAKIVINAAGNYSDTIAQMINKDIDWKITPRKGEYFVLDHKVKNFVNHVIFPLPSEKGKGVLVAPTTAGNYIVGPSSELDDDKDDVSTDKLTLDNIKAQANLLVKNIPYNTCIRTFAGSRPTCTRHDFVIEKDSKYDHFINVGGIESPGLVSAPAIAKYVVEELVSSISLLINKENYNPRVRRYPHIKDSEERRKEMVTKNPEFGEMICNCEEISLGEIKDILSRSVPPRSVKGVKRRVRAGFGRCQGGFCQPKVVLILAKHYGISPLEVPLDDTDSKILLKEVKEVR